MDLRKLDAAERVVDHLIHVCSFRTLSRLIATCRWLADKVALERYHSLTYTDISDFVVKKQSTKRDPGSNAAPDAAFGGAAVVVCEELILGVKDELCLQQIQDRALFYRKLSIVCFIPNTLRLIHPWLVSLKINCYETETINFKLADLLDNLPLVTELMLPMRRFADGKNWASILLAWPRISVINCWICLPATLLVQEITSQLMAFTKIGRYCPFLFLVSNCTMGSGEHISMMRLFVRHRYKFFAYGHSWNNLLYSCTFYRKEESHLHRSIRRLLRVKPQMRARSSFMYACHVSG